MRSFLTVRITMGLFCFLTLFLLDIIFKIFLTTWFKGKFLYNLYLFSPMILAM